jgi:biotin carboxyl carrier protein
MIYNITIRDRIHRLQLNHDGEKWECELNGRKIGVNARGIRRGVISLLIEGNVYEVRRDKLGKQTRIWIRNQVFLAEMCDPRDLRSRSPATGTSAPARLLASMPGKVLRVMVSPLDQVEIGQPLLVVEAMKMQNEIKSTNQGTVRQIAREGTRVNAGEVLAVVE